MKLFGSLLGGNENPEKTSLPWIPFKDLSILEDILNTSYDIPVLIYKHSTRCGISSMMRHRLERNYDLEKEQLCCYFIDLIKYRDISNKVASKLGIAHESPQVLLIRDGRVVHNASHGSISLDLIKKHLD